jgi:hypothetical protein
VPILAAIPHLPHHSCSLTLSRRAPNVRTLSSAPSVRSFRLRTGGGRRAYLAILRECPSQYQLPSIRGSEHSAHRSSFIYLLTVRTGTLVPRFRVGFRIAGISPDVTDCLLLFALPSVLSR